MEQGFRKLERRCEKARLDGFQWVLVAACSIGKSWSVLSCRQQLIQCTKSARILRYVKNTKRMSSGGIARLIWLCISDVVEFQVSRGQQVVEQRLDFARATAPSIVEFYVVD